MNDNIIRIALPTVSEFDLININEHFHEDIKCLEYRIHELSNRFGSAHEVFGMEHRFCYMLGDLYGFDKTPDYIKRAFIRRSQEPIILSYRESFIRWNINNSLILAMTSLLAETNVEFSIKDLNSESIHHGKSVIFDSVRSNETLQLDISNAGNFGLSSTILAAYCYARVVSGHGLTDGNGRFARALIHGAYIRSGISVGAILPLGPIFRILLGNRISFPEILSGTKDWLIFVNLFTKTLSKTIATVHAIINDDIYLLKKALSDLENIMFYPRLLK